MHGRIRFFLYFAVFLCGFATWRESAAPKSQFHAKTAKTRKAKSPDFPSRFASP